APAPTEPRGHGPRRRTCSSSCSSWLQSLRSGSLRQSRRGSAVNFNASSYTDPTGRNLRSFNMDRDGFTDLVLGFTGAKARQFKKAYIAAYNTLEARAFDDLKRQVQIQRMADAIGMAKAMGLIQPGQKGRLEDIVRPFLGDLSST
ncbi:MULTISPECIES: Rha family transcriptional regulator, partial [unclassified Xanthobacter]|uniref:Rha family transcriptional regulator n=1 Tax=unclassified Xanthobacter TaxID=2623496 RepID=UPI001EE1383A